MKKLLKSVLAICLLLCMSVGFAACGELELTKENLVGSYKITHVVYTASEENTAGYASCDYTPEQYNALLAKIDAGTQTAKEQDDYYIVSGYFECVIEVREDGTIYDIWEDSPEFKEGEWKIEDGKLVYTCSYDHLDTYSAEWDDGKIIITHLNERPDPTQGTIVITLEKVED